jgi:hypothetical protein
VAACSPATLASSASPWPRALTAMPALKSRYFRSVVSQTQDPFPRCRIKGGRAYVFTMLVSISAMRVFTDSVIEASSSGWVTDV